MLTVSQKRKVNEWYQNGEVKEVGVCQVYSGKGIKYSVVGRYEGVNRYAPFIEIALCDGKEEAISIARNVADDLRSYQNIHVNVRMSDVELEPSTSKRPNIRTLPANRMQYLLDNYPATTDVATIRATEKSGETEVWFMDDVLRAMQAAFNAGKRDKVGATDTKLKGLAASIIGHFEAGNQDIPMWLYQQAKKIK